MPRQRFKRLSAFPLFVRCHRIKSEMSVDESILAALAHLIDFSTNRPFICQHVRKLTSKTKSKPIIFIATDFSLYVAKLNKWKKNYEIGKKKSWFEITKIDIQRDDVLIIKFHKKKIIITHPDSVLMHELIRAHCKKFMRENEMPEYSFISNDLVARNTSFQPALRFMVKMFTKDIKMSDEIYKQLTNYFNNNPIEFVLSQFPELAEFLFDLLECFSLQVSLSILVIDLPLTERIVNDLAKFIRINSSISKLIIRAQIEKNLSPIVEALKLDTSPFITDLMICGVFIKDEIVENILEILNTHTLDSLTLECCLLTEPMNLFLSKGAKCLKIRNLKQLKLAKSQSINLDLLMPLTHKLRVLNISESHVEVASVFSYISKSKTCQIQKLVLSKNQGTVSISKIHFFPPSLQYIKLNRVIWKQEVLLDVLQMIAMHKTKEGPFDFALRSAGFTPKAWNMLLDALNLMETANFRKLVWDNNFIDTRFINYIQNCPKLQSLSLVDCIKRDPSSIYSLSKFIVKSKTLTRLNISITTPFKLKATDLSVILVAIGKNRTLQELNMNNIILEDTIFDQLANTLLSNKRISTFNFNFIGISSNSLKKFFETLSTRGSRLSFEYPEASIESLRQNYQISQNEIIVIKNQHRMITEGNGMEQQASLSSEGSLSSNDFDMLLIPKPRSKTTMNLTSLSLENIMPSPLMMEAPNSFADSKLITRPRKRRGLKDEFPVAGSCDILPTVSKFSLPLELENEYMSDSVQEQKKLSSNKQHRRSSELSPSSSMVSSFHLGNRRSANLSGSVIFDPMAQLVEDKEWPIFVPNTGNISYEPILLELKQTYDFCALLSRIKA